PCLRTPDGAVWTYADLKDRADRIAAVLVEDHGLVPGNRVLLRSANNPMMVATWFAVMKAGGIAVATMPLLRAKELVQVIEKAQVTHAVCDARLIEELDRARAEAPVLARVATYNGGPGGLEDAMAAKSAPFVAVDTASDDVCLIAFTSGTTGQPKGTMHFHRDVMAIADCFPPTLLKAGADDVFTGSPPLAFTFGLGGMVIFPMRVGASTLLLERAAPDLLAAAIAAHKVTVCFTAPTAWRALVGLADAHDLTSLRRGVSAGEALPRPTFEAVETRLGIKLIDGLGATEMLHIFVSSADEGCRPGATGREIPGYRAKVVDDDGNEVPRGTPGRLAVIGPTGCRYLDDPRQTTYVRDGWNLTGDAYLMDADGYLFYQGRTDDMIVAAGYNIGGPEVEDALLTHPSVRECGVVGAPDEGRGTVVKASVVPAPGVVPGPDLVKDLQDHVKRTIAPYKYPRAIEFVDVLPRTETGKLQRFRLREMAKGG
ncbi:MAG: AMP-binding protein, partial [Rhodospirillales bacterium]